MIELRKEVQQKGKLENVLLIDTELKRLKTGLPGRNSELKDLAQIQTIFHKHYALQAPRVFMEQHRVEDAYGKGLEKFVADMTQQGKLEGALEVNKLLADSKERSAKLKHLAKAGVDDADPFAYFNWKKLGEAISTNQLENTDHVGGNPQSNPTTRDLPEEPSVLVGFDFYHGPFGGSKDTVRRIVPLFRTEKEKVVEGKPRAGARGERKSRLLAKDGYVVSGISTVSEAGVRKMKVEFQRLDGMKTVSDGKYESEWYGEWDGGREASLSTNGKIPVGVDGWVGLGTGEFWLLVVKSK